MAIGGTLTVRVSPPNGREAMATTGTLARRRADDGAAVLEIARREDARGDTTRAETTPAEVESARGRDSRPVSESELYGKCRDYIRKRRDCRKLSRDELDSLAREMFLYVWRREGHRMPPRSKIDGRYLLRAIGRAFDAPMRWKDSAGAAPEVAAGSPADDGADSVTGIDFTRPIGAQALEEEGRLVIPTADAVELAAALDVPAREARGVIAAAAGMTADDMTAAWPEITSVESARVVKSQALAALRRRYPEPRDFLSALRAAVKALELKRGEYLPRVPTAAVTELVEWRRGFSAFPEYERSQIIGIDRDDWRRKSWARSCGGMRPVKRHARAGRRVLPMVPRVALAKRSASQVRRMEAELARAVEAAERVIGMDGAEQEYGERAESVAWRSEALRVARIQAKRNACR